MDIPEDIYEDALALQKTGRATHSDNQRMAAMAGYESGAMHERNRYDAALSIIDQRLAKIDRVLSLMIESLKQ